MDFSKFFSILVIGMIIGSVITSLSNDNQQKLSSTTEHYKELDVTNDKSFNLPLEQKESMREVKQINCPQQHNVTEKTSCSNEVTELLKIKTSLEQKNQKLEKEFQQSQYKLMALERKVGELDESDITDQDLSALVPKNYEGLVVNFHGKLRDDIFNFHNKPEDLDWGFEMTNNIYYFIDGHEYSYGVKLNSITCKELHCEVLITEKERPSWDRIYHSMIKQDWWKFTSINSSSSDDLKGDNTIIYYFLSI